MTCSSVIIWGLREAGRWDEGGRDHMVTIKVLASSLFFTRLKTSIQIAHQNETVLQTRDYDESSSVHLRSK